MPTIFLVTSSDEFENAAQAELRRHDPKLKLGRSLAPGLFEITTQFAADDFAAIVAQDPPIYARHMFPVAATVTLDKTLADLDRLVEAVESLPRLTELDDTTEFAIQARLVEAEEGQASRYPYTPFAIKERLAAVIAERTGATENIREPQEVLSVVCLDEQAYVGLSPADLNLSSWAGGMRRFSKRPEQISRAELKLQEALEVFDLELPTAGYALDLGAAPGGWTRMLLAAGLDVTAIDPAFLDPRLEDLPGLHHYQSYAERFLETALTDPASRGLYAIIAGDLRMDATMAARLLVAYAPLLAPDGFALTTLKLPHETAKLKPALLADHALTILRQTYRQVQARQLFHNRQEITVYLRKI